MDTETFILTRQKIQMRMEEKRQDISVNPSSFHSNGFLAAVPFLFSTLKNIFNHNKKTLTRTILTTVGFRILSPFIARRVWGLFSKTKPAIS